LDAAAQCRRYTAEAFSTAGRAGNELIHPHEKSPARDHRTGEHWRHYNREKKETAQFLCFAEMWLTVFHEPLREQTLRSVELIYNCAELLLANASACVKPRRLMRWHHWLPP